MLNEKFLTVSDIAKIFQLNPQTVRNWIDAGALPAVRIGTRRVRVRESDLVSYLERHTAAKQPPATEDQAVPEELQARDDPGAEFFQSILGEAQVGETAVKDLADKLRAFGEAAIALSDALVRVPRTDPAAADS